MGIYITKHLLKTTFFSVIITFPSKQLKKETSRIADHINQKYHLYKVVGVKKTVNKQVIINIALASLGAQGITMCVRLSVPSVTSCLEHSKILHLSLSVRSVLGMSQASLSSLSLSPHIAYYINITYGA